MSCSPKSRCPLGHALSEDVREESVSCFSPDSGIARNPCNPWSMGTSFQSLPLWSHGVLPSGCDCFCVFTPTSKNQSSRMKDQFYSRYHLISTVYIVQPYFQIRSHPEVLGRILILGDTIQPRTAGHTIFLVERNFPYCTPSRSEHNCRHRTHCTKVRCTGDVWSVAHGEESGGTGMRWGHQQWELRLERPLRLKWENLWKPPGKILTLSSGSHCQVLTEKWWRWWGVYDSG